MGLDQQGYFWLSDPSVAAVAIVVAVGLLLWCHLSLGSDTSERSAAVPVRARRTLRMHGPTRAPGRGLRCRVAVERERRDASHRRVA